MIINNTYEVSQMRTWEKMYRWKKTITKFFSIETKVSMRKKTERICEEQSWLGIG
jgi:hypothetical protein